MLNLNIFILIFMKLLIYGGGGWIGKQFIQILKNNNVEYAEGVSR
mgnify:FL=1